MNPGFNRCILCIKLDVLFYLCFVRNDKINKLYIYCEEFGKNWPRYNGTALYCRTHHAVWSRTNIRRVAEVGTHKEKIESELPKIKKNMLRIHKTVTYSSVMAVMLMYMYYFRTGGRYNASHNGTAKERRFPRRFCLNSTSESLCSWWTSVQRYVTAMHVLCNYIRRAV